MTCLAKMLHKKKDILANHIDFLTYFCFDSFPAVTPRIVGPCVVSLWKTGGLLHVLYIG